MRGRRGAAGWARIEISAKLGRHGAEALRLEAQRLARRYGIEISDIRVERPEPRSRSRG